MTSPALKSGMNTAGTVIGREITRSIFGTGRRRVIFAETGMSRLLSAAS